MAGNQNRNSSTSKTTKKVSANRSYNSKRSPQKTIVKTAAVAAATVGARKIAKKMGGKSIAVIITCFILAFAIGAGICFFLGKNDKFDMLGAEQVVINVDEKYTDEGVDIREFGINLSKKAIIDTDLKTDGNGNYYAESAGDYYIAYTVKSLKFGFIYPVQKIRLINVIGASEGGE